MYLQFFWHCFVVWCDSIRMQNSMFHSAVNTMVTSLPDWLAKKSIWSHVACKYRRERPEVPDNLKLTGASALPAFKNAWKERQIKSYCVSILKLRLCLCITAIPCLCGCAVRPAAGTGRTHNHIGLAEVLLLLFSVKNLSFSGLRFKSC